MTDSPKVYKSSELSETSITEQENLSFTETEFALAIAVAILSFGFVKFALFNITGFITTALYIAIITTTVVYLRKKEYTFSKFNKLLTVILYLFSIVFSITDTSFIKILNTYFLFGSGAYLIYSVSSSRTDIDRYLPIAMKKAVIEFPFSRFKAQQEVLKEGISNSKFGNNLKMIILGLILTIPLTVIVANLLMSADEGMKKMITGFTDNINPDTFRATVIQLLIAIPCSCYLFGMFYSNVYKSDNILTEDICEETLKRSKFISNMILYTAITPICILYILFFISQANYFLSAFFRNLPDGYSYAEYARKGFFELCTVTLINLGVIVSINVFAKESGRNKPVSLKVYSIALCVFTLFLIVTAVSKMVMYISEYGFTQLRVYTTWFMILCVVIFILILVKQFRFDFSIAKWISVSFTIMFGFLCFSRPEALIAKCNIEMYNSGMISELDTDKILEMSDDALLVAVDSGVISESEVGDARYNNSPYANYNVSSLILNSKID